MVKIVIDAGHGGKDPGAVANNLQEKDITLKISKYMQDYLQDNYSNVQIRLTRSTDIFIELSERANIANQFDADVFISNHVNAGGGSGFESFIYTSPSRASRNLQNAVNAEALAVAETYGLGAHGNDKKRGNLAVVRETTMPAILTEIAFIDNEDANLLKRDDFLRDMAAAYARGIAKFLGLNAKGTSNQKATTSSQRATTSKGSTSVRIETGGLTADNVKEISEYLISKKWYARITFTKDGNPKALTGGLSTDMRREFEAWLKERGWYYEIIE
jgi:N-acetylmuramoyl-L-alanine amidase